MEKLELFTEVVEVTTKEGKAFSFNGYYVVVNGIKLSLKPNDNTVKQVLEDYFKKLK